MVGGGQPAPYARCTFPFFKPLSCIEPGDTQWRGFTARVADSQLSAATGRPSQSASPPALPEGEPSGVGFVRGCVLCWCIRFGRVRRSSSVSPAASHLPPGGRVLTHFSRPLLGFGAGGSFYTAPLIRQPFGLPPSPEGEGFGAVELGGCKDNPTLAAGACPRPTHGVRSFCLNY